MNYGTSKGISQTVADTLRWLGYDFSDTTIRDTARQVDSAWRFIAERKEQVGGQRPTRPEGIIGWLAANKLKAGASNTIFSPWGPRYKIKNAEIADSSPETATIVELREIFRKFSEIGYKFRFLLMPADVYGTEINRLPPDFVKTYFESLAKTASRELGAFSLVEVRPWSQIRKEAQSRYDVLNQEASQRLRADAYNPLVIEAIQTAKYFDPSNPKESALRYVVERLVEAQIINEIYNPIKLSLVKKEKDSLDGDLKRVYIIKNKAPWMSTSEQITTLQRQ